MKRIFVRQLGYPFRFHNGVIVGHLMLGKTDRFAKIIFYFSRGHTNAKCEVIISDKRVNLGDKSEFSIKTQKVQRGIYFHGTTILVRNRGFRIIPNSNPALVVGI